jgi:hypothetical protein
MKVVLTAMIGAILLAAPPASAQVEPVEADYVARGFRFGTGETLPELKLH